MRSSKATIAQRVAVARRPGAFALSLLGREVAGRAEHRPGDRQRVHAGRAGDPEVCDAEAALLVEEQVPGLDVTMDDAVSVRRVQCGRSLLEPAERLVARRRSLLQPVLEGATLEMLHDDERAAAPLADVEDRDRVRLRGEARGCKRLPCEPRPDRFVARVPLGEDLDRNGAAEDLVLGSKDLAHAPVADPVGIPVAGGQDVVFVCHSGRSVQRLLQIATRHGAETPLVQETFLKFL